MCYKLIEFLRLISNDPPYTHHQKPFELHPQCSHIYTDLATQQIHREDPENVKYCVTKGLENAKQCSSHSFLYMF